ncbi:MAG: penicillin-binding protein 2 [Candidatus Saccharimonadales bacterium]|nr:penicillin-binding protein 2 [Candidatus Saccharimonadales bacterium]
MKFNFRFRRQNPLGLEELKRTATAKKPDRTSDSFAWQRMMMPQTDEAAPNITVNQRSLLPLMMIAGVVILALGLSLRLYFLQVLAGDHYDQLANGNRIRETINYAPRGNIYDRNGVLLATNTITFQLSATPYLLETDEAERADDYKALSKLVDLSAKEIIKKAEAQGDAYPLPLLIASNVDHKKAIAIQQVMPELKGFSLDEVPTRKYKSDSALAHILGYVGRVDEADLDNDTTGRLLPVDFIGKTGVEHSYDDVLRGVNGLERTEVDALGRPVRLLAQQPAERGQDIYLTIDYEVQKRLASEIKKQMKLSKTSRASGVALDPESGAVIAMVSLPGYDSNLFAGGINSKSFKKLVNNPDQPLINKVIQGGYTTGSTIKPVVASAALEEKVVTPDTIIVDTGAIAVTSVYDPGASFVFRGWRPGGLGPMNVRRAIAMSSNIYFYTVGGGHGVIGGLGGERLSRYYRHFGMGTASGIDMPNEIDGRVPDEKWKQENKGENWFVGDSYNISIGQGDMLVSPLQLTLADMTIANDGYLLRPYIVDRIGDKPINGRKVIREVDVSKNNLQIVREGMRMVLTNGTTCECTFSKVPHKVAGKSGTAQTTSNDERRPHAWYTAFAPYENPQIMATVMIEEGSGGSTFSAPAIAGAMETFFKN